MGKVFKWIGILIGGLAGLVGVILAGVYFVTESRLNKIYEVQTEAIAVSSDPATITRGLYLANTIGFCVECHGDNLAGEVFDDGPLIGRLAVSNLTPGKGGVGDDYTTDDWVRAIRHGVGRDGKSLISMPSHVYYHFSDADLAAIVAYLENLPAVDNELPETEFGPMVRMFILMDSSLLPAEVIDHDAPRPPAPEPGVTAEYGRYLAVSCTLCHGENLAGGSEPGAGLNLTPGGNLGRWTEEEFIHAMRTGKTPEGNDIDPEMMPFDLLGQLNENELRAIWIYLRSLPAVETPEVTAGR